MASWLVLDWDQDQFHIVVAQTSRRNVEVTRAFTWSHPEPCTPSTADRVGKALRDFLRTAKIAAAPVIVGLGRDRIFLKELRFPAIEAHEEANLVRFQTAKELTESIDSYALDYVHLNGDKGDREIMTVAARREIIGMVQTLCQAAGLKLHAVTPRVFGVGQALQRALKPQPNPLTANRLNVVLTIGQRWAELCFFKGERLLQAQALANGPMLVGEVKRNIAVFGAQHAVNVDLSGPDSLHVFGENGAVVEALRSGLTLPVELLNPLKDEPDIAADLAHPAYFAGSVGLVALWSQAVQKPANLVAPKRQTAPATVTKQRGLFYGAAALVGVFMFIGLLWGLLAVQRARLRQIIAEKNSIEKQLNDSKQERAEIEAYKDWEQSTVSWLDELHDLTARYPYKEGFRVNSFAATSTGTKKGLKDNYIGKITLNGIMPLGKDEYVKQFTQNMVGDTHVKPHVEEFQGQVYKMKIDVARQQASQFKTALTVEKRRFLPALAPDPKLQAKAPPEEKKMDPNAEDENEP